MEARNVFVCTAEKLTRNHTYAAQQTQGKVAAADELIFTGSEEEEAADERRN